MSIKKGIWRLKIEAVEELSDVDRQYIAKKNQGRILGRRNHKRKRRFDN